ncbi:MAG: efflux RND transporter permease subunit [Candidatus Desantisbacteria bacterium]
MSITNLAIKNHLTVFVLVLLIIITGTIAYVTLPREAAPDITIPYVIVQTPYMGVSPADIETLVTNPIEKKLKALENVKNIRSTSADNISVVTIEFLSGTDINDAVRKVKDKVDQAKTDLPVDAEDPQVIEINLSDMPIMVINISSDAGLVKLKTIADELKDKIETVKGILEVTIAGELEREILIQPDMGQLKKYKLSFDTISKAIQAANINIPGGTIDVGGSKYLIRIPGEFKSTKQIENIVADTINGTPIYIRDIAKVLDTFKEKTSYARLNNKDSISLSIQKRSGENLLVIADKIKTIVNEEKVNLPSSTKLNIIADQSTEIKDMVDELENSIMLGLVLVVLALFLFMGIRNSMFVATAIPLSMLITFNILQLMGITLNMVCLFSLILALGRLVDDSIVIVENIYRHIQEGYSRIEAAKIATREVAGPVISSTLTTVAAFTPLLFMPGISGQFMRYIPIGVIITILASLFVALVINPVFCAVFMTVSKKKRDRDEKSEVFVQKSVIVSFYRKVLIQAISHKKATILLSLLAFVFSICLFGITNPGFEFFPATTPTKVYINIKAPDGANLKYTDQIVSSIERIMFKHPNIDRIISTVGSQSGGGHSFTPGASNSQLGTVIAEFKEIDKQTESPIKTISWIRNRISKIPGAEIEIVKESMGPPTGAAIGIKVSGKDYLMLSSYAQQIKNILHSLPGVVDVKDDYSKGRQEIIIDINQDKAARVNANTAMVACSVRTAIQGSKISVYREGNEEYDITLRLPSEQRVNISDIEQLNIAAKEGIQVPLGEIATVRTSGGINSINHLDSDRVITVQANPAEGYLATERLQVIAKKLKNLKLSTGYKVDFVGESEMRDEMGGYLKKAFVIALLLIALVLITQFNSLLLPFIILSSVLLSLIGVFLGLVIFHRPFGIVMTGIGIITLAGVIVCNAIVLIDFIQQLRLRGFDRYSAVITAGAVRLRPVLLTAITTILGLVPMTFGINFNFKLFFASIFSGNLIGLLKVIELGGKSTEFWGSMGSAVTIGMAVGTILTLVVVPSLYIIFDDWREKAKLFVKR